MTQEIESIGIFLRPRCFPRRDRLRLLSVTLVLLLVVVELAPASLSIAEEKSGPSAAASGAQSAEIIRAQAEYRKVDNDITKTTDARWQFYLDYVQHIFLIIVIAGLFIWAFPQIQEFTLAFGSETFSAKKPPKEPLSVTPSGPAAPLVSQAAHLLAENLAPGPGKESIIGRLTESEVYESTNIIKDTLYICHRTQKIPRRDNYRLQIYLDADAPSILDKVEKVTYILHPTFSPNEITRDDRENQFRLEIEAWGEFMLAAKVYLKGAPEKPVELKRYLNF